MEKNRAYFIISVGIVNLLHGFIHLFQFIHSILLVGLSSELLTEIVHNPFFNFSIGMIGVISLWIGVIDYRHHKICKEVND